MIKAVLIWNIEVVKYQFKHFLTSGNHVYQFWGIVNYTNLTFSSCLVGDHLDSWDKRRFCSSNSDIFSWILSFLFKRVLVFQATGKSIVKIMKLKVSIPCFIGPFWGFLPDFISVISIVFLKKDPYKLNKLQASQKSESSPTEALILQSLTWN